MIMSSRSKEPIGIDQLWRDTARRASDSQLAVSAALMIPVVLGTVVATLLDVGVVRWWPVLLIPLFISAFGFWGIADREIKDRGQNQLSSGTPGWRTLRSAAVGLAIGCAAVATLLFLRLTLGRWIS
jgi:cation transport ATPase